MNAKKYRVAWKSATTNQQGHGEPFTREDAKAIADYYNMIFPTIKHWIEPVQETSDEC